MSLPSPPSSGAPVCHDTTVVIYAAYLGVYEPGAASVQELCTWWSTCHGW